ncbi:DNA-processing protein DprA [Brachybacterium paraconglomeratum]|uniref:DNA-processing protein DprA n=1 Tax=Brachybacterium paraconglomeratum TaxID=173362 RepID=UPI003FD3F1D7
MAELAGQLQDERQARMALSMIAEPNDQLTGGLLRRVSGIETIRLLQGGDRVPNVNGADALAWRRRLGPRVVPDVMDQVHAAQAAGYGVLIPGDEHWPAGLADLGAGEPYVLWVRGATSLLGQPMAEQATITGARAATAYGTHVAQEFASELAADEVTVVSGGAYGIDAAAHRGALAAGGYTVAVLAGGVDRPYPAGNRELLERVSAVGATVSEMPPGAAPTRWRFLARNRVMAAMSASTVVVEAGYRSGSLGVAGLAHELGRTVGAVPGPVTSAASSGAHRLLQQGMASLVTHAGDILELVGHADAPSEAPARQVGHNAPETATTKDVPGRAL